MFTSSYFQSVTLTPGVRFSPWSCPICSTQFETKNPIKGHMVKHFKSEIKEKYLNKEDPTKCSLCSHKTENTDHMVHHIAWTHQKLRDFLTQGKKSVDKSRNIPTSSRQ